MRRSLRDFDGSSHPACAALEKWLLNHPRLRTIAIYSALPGEVDLSTIILGRADLAWVYPKIRGHHLTFHPGGDLRPGPFNLLEPTDSPEVPVLEIDAFICPGLAFDVTGGRLGRGRGYYDRLLAQARPNALKIGICFEFQLVPDTFPEAHDVLMDAVICPREKEL